ncbi:putative TNF-receptor-associated factor 1 [Paratrimastix pyriformis]|uniref:TNF-receptor-associated factor 1 n=1 Tax=Paratrimastix pyriformis TaxID=342808 RepID=A0ABQ8UMT6_9EUKA|nr:putative TNF-receptor-associated factor 1 [Paratrimastix pyriformis]
MADVPALEEGYPTDRFVDPSSVYPEFICPICQCVMRSPVNVLCEASHKMCENCCTAWFRKSRTCPSCREAAPPQAPRRDISLANMISRLTIACFRKDLGCQWTGKLEMLAKHEDSECGFRLLNCPNQGCPERALAKCLPSHLESCPFKPLVCQFCKQSYLQRDKNHPEQCPKSPIPCPRKCGTMVSRDSLPGHLLVCVDVTCICGEKGPRGLVERHLTEDLLNHFFMLAQRLAVAEHDLAACKQALAQKGIAIPSVGAPVPVIPAPIAPTVATSLFNLPSLPMPLLAPVAAAAPTYKSDGIAVSTDGTTAIVKGVSTRHNVLLSETKITRGWVEITILVHIPQPASYYVGCVPEIPTPAEMTTGFRLAAVPKNGWGLHDYEQSVGIYSRNELAAPSKSGFKTGNYVRMRIDVDAGDLIFWVNDAQCAEIRRNPQISAGCYPMCVMFNEGAEWKLVAVTKSN